MQHFRDLAVSTKLALSFFLVLLLMAAVGLFSTWQLGNLKEQSAQVAQVHLPGVRESLLMSELASSYRTHQYRLVAVQANERPQVRQLMDKALRDFDAHRALYEKSVSSGPERQLLDQAVAKWADYAKVSKEVDENVQGGMMIEARDLLGADGLKRFDAVADALRKLSAYNDLQANEAAARSDTTFLLSRRLIIGALVLAIAVAALLAWWVARSITVPLKQAVTLAKAVAAGDLTSSLHSTGRDEVAQLTDALATMVDQLRHLVHEVRKGVESVSSASTEIASGNMDLSDRTQQTATRLHATAHRMDELTATVSQAADTAGHADQLAQQAAQAAQDGGLVVNDVITSMSEISGSSTKIAEIIGVIDSIAFQTNVLALNAAVESARAGEQGRGFAVVAGEVRTLAHRSAAAAKEIKTLIDTSVLSVRTGVSKVGEAHASMDGIRHSVQQVTDLMTRLSGAARDQRSSVQEVNEAITMLEGMTQQNAALVEESAAAAALLRDQAARLHSLIAVFRVEPSGS